MAKLSVKLEYDNGSVSSVWYELPSGEARELFEQFRDISYRAYERTAWAPSEAAASYAFEDSWKNCRPLGVTVPRVSALPADHPAIILQENDGRSELASYFQPDEGGEA